MKPAGGRRLALGLGAVAALVAAGLVVANRDRIAVPASRASPAPDGAALFATVFAPQGGLGPLYNETSCLACHSAPAPGGMAPGSGLGTVIRVGRLTNAGFDPLMGHGGPVARAHSVAELGLPCHRAPGIPAAANVTSVRNAPALFGAGLIDAIPDQVIVAGAVPRGDGVHGRPNLVRAADGTERVGRFGWKADTPTLAQFVAEAFRNELGLTNPLAPFDVLPAAPPGAARCRGESETPEDDGTIIKAVTAYVASLPPPSASESSPRGEQLFTTIGCVACHTPRLSLGDRQVSLFSDLLLHDVGPGLDDKFVQSRARGQDWRTTPLWGLGRRPRLLHDGRAQTIEAAIVAHGGEATAAARRFRQLAGEDRDALLTFLRSL